MKAKIIHPQSNIILPHDARVVFLAGPVQGADDWQMQLGEQLAEQLEDIFIATPRVPKKDNSFDYLRQVSWEKTHLQLAAKNGILVFWFAAQNPNLDYESGRAYAQTTRLEIGRAFGWLDHNPDLKLVVGFDKDYAKNGGGSERYIRTLCAEHDISLTTSIEDTVSKILMLALPNSK